MVIFTTSVVADIPCAESICVGLPQVSGNVINEIYFNGDIQETVNITDYSMFGYNREVFYSIDAGATWSTNSVKYGELPFNNEYLNFRDNAEVLILNNGKILISWHEDELDGLAVLSQKVYTKIFNKDGSIFQDKILITTISSPSYTNIPTGLSGYYEQHHRFVKTANSNVNEYFVIWYEENNIYYQIRNLDGNIVKQKTRLNKNNNNVSNIPNDYFRIIELENNNGMVAVYRDGNRDYVIEIFDITGNVKGRENVLLDEDSNIGGYDIVALGGDNAGGFVLARDVYDDGSESSEIKSQMYNYNGDAKGAEISIVPPSTRYSYLTPRLIAYDSGGYLVSYLSLLSETSSYRSYGARDNIIDYVYRRVSNAGLLIDNSDKAIWNEPYSSRGNDEVVYPVITADEYDVKNPTLMPNLIYLGGTDIVAQWHSIHLPGGVSYSSPADGHGYTLVNSFKNINNADAIQHNHTRNYYNCSSYTYPNSQCAYFGDFIREVKKIDQDTYLAKTSGKNVAAAANAFLPKLLLISKNKKSAEQYIGTSNITSNIALKVKVVDKDTGIEYFSPVRNLIYANPNDGSDGSISYLDILTNLKNINVDINMTCQTCDVLQVSQRVAPLTAGTCGDFNAWSLIGSTSALDISRVISVNDGQCYQFKANAINEVLSINNEYISSNTIRVDQSKPVIIIQGSNLSYDTLTLDLQSLDSVSGIATQTYELNSSGVQNIFTGNTLSLLLTDGVNRIRLTVMDQAGNSHSVDHFVTADLTPPQINIIGLIEGETYSDDPNLVYSFTQDLTDVVITVDGVVSDDLTGLTDGAHTLVITGNFGTTPVTQTVNFIIDSNAFSFQLLSPQDGREYQYNTIPIQYQANKTLNSLSYALDGGPAQNELNLQNLTNGDHTLVVTAVSSDTDNEVRTINFSVQQSIPTLSVSSPVNGGVYQDLTVALNATSDSIISLQLDGVVISNTTSSLVFTEDAQHTLIITATHPVSNSMVSESITFRTDSVIPVVTILNPESKLYTDGNIPINFITNKPLENVQYRLNGNLVKSISNLTIGNYTFRMTASDTAGRSIDMPVSFQIAKLDFVTPVNNSQIISNVIPPSVNVKYTSEGDFDNYTLAVDDKQANLLDVDNGQGPESNIPVVVMPGDHELTLRGLINSETVGARVNFNVGAKNIYVGPGSIDYVYTGCDASFNNCNVVVELKINNIGDYDINENIAVRFDHVDLNGSESFWVNIPSLESKTNIKKILLPFKASLGDTLTVNVDPNAELSAEWTDDNIYSIEFTAGQIENVEQLLDAKNVYIENVSVFNTMAVITSGPVDKIEFRINGWIFENNDKDNSFISTIDMGLLDKDSYCIDIRAISADDIVLDATVRCFAVSSLNMQGLTKYTYTWELHQTQTKHVVLDAINASVMLKQIAFIRHLVLSSPAAIYANIEEGGKVDYKFHYDPGAIDNRVSILRTEWASDGFLNGNIGLENGQSIFISTIDPSREACNVNGAIPINFTDREELLSDVYAEELAEINKNNVLLDLLSPSEQTILMQFSQSGFHYSSYSIIAFEEVFGDADRGNAALQDQFRKARESNAVFDFIAGFFDLKFVTISWLHGDIPENLYEVKLNGSLRKRFTGDKCILVDKGTKDIELRMEGYYDFGLVDASLDLNINDIKLDGSAYSYIGWGVPGTDLGFHIPMLFSNIKVRLYGLNINIPLDYGIRHGIKIVDNNLQEFGPFHARFGLSINVVNHQLTRAEAEVYPLFMSQTLGLGFGADFKVHLNMVGEGKFDLIAGQGFDDQFYNYVDYNFSAKLYKRKKICFFNKCHHKSWKLDDVLFERPLADENIPFGHNYTQQQVKNDLDLIGAPWPER